MKISFLFLIGFLFFLETTNAQPQPTDGLVGYFPFNGNANDESGRGKHGVVSSATLTKDRFGNENNAYYFDGIDDYIVLPDSILSEKDSIFTITFWFYPLSDSGMIITDRSNENELPYFENYFYYYLSNHSGSQYIGNINSMYGYAYYQTSEGQFISKKYGEKVSFIPDMKWHLGTVYINFTNAAKTFKIGETTYLKEIFKGIKTISLGKDLSKSPKIKPFMGMIDDVRIYNRQLSNNELNLIADDTLATSNVTIPRKESNIVLFPQAGKLKIISTNQQPTNITLLQINGEIVLTACNQNHYEINNLHGGTYILQSKNNNSVEIQKVIIP